MHRQRLFLGTFLPLVALLLISCGTVTPTTAQEKRDPSLYERLGRYDAIAAVCEPGRKTFPRSSTAAV